MIGMIRKKIIYIYIYIYLPVFLPNFIFYFDRFVANLYTCTRTGMLMKINLSAGFLVFVVGFFLSSFLKIIFIASKFNA